MFGNDVAFCVAMSLEGHILPYNSLGGGVCLLPKSTGKRETKGVSHPETGEVEERIGTGTLKG